jgi:hypothetical protein
MTLYRTLLATILVAMIGQPQSSRAEPRSPQGGIYEITARLELPHLERWGVDKATTICLPNIRGDDEIPVPVLSASNPFAKCTVANLMSDGPKLEYDIVCPGRGAAKGRAVYILSANTFSGRVAMVMGAKNMTMTEVQHARRIAECSPATFDPTARSY